MCGAVIGRVRSECEPRETGGKFSLEFARFSPARSTDLKGTASSLAQLPRLTSTGRLGVEGGGGEVREIWTLEWGI